MNDAMPTCHNDAEQLAAFMDGHLGHDELQEVTAHLAECEECRGLLREAALFEQEEAAAQRAPRRGAWWAVAVAAVVVVAAIPFARGYWHQREIRTEVHDVYAAQTKRLLAGRFSGEEFHGRYSPKRGADDEDNDNYKLPAATSQLHETTKDDNSPAGLRARALAEATDKDWKTALQTINQIPENARDAATWNDIAVITLANNDPAEALTAVNRALQLAPKMPEALFTRWAILRTPQAAQQYLAVDSSSPWAEEIRQRMQPLQ
jgi:tetratricopeptide (TPR) repeat protein